MKFPIERLQEGKKKIYVWSDPVTIDFLWELKKKPLYSVLC